MNQAQMHHPEEFSTAVLVLGPLTATGSAQNGALIDTTGYEALIADVSINYTGTISAGSLVAKWQATSDSAGASPAPADVVHNDGTTVQSGTLNVFTGAISGDALPESGVYSAGTQVVAGASITPTAMLSLPLDMSLATQGKYVRLVVTATETGGGLGEVVATLRKHGPSTLPTPSS